MVTDATPELAQLLIESGIAEIGGLKFECSQFFGLYGLNEIPHAHFVLTPSTDPGMPQSVPQIYDMLGKLKPGTPVKVTFKFTGRTRIDQRLLASEPIVLFEGLLEGWGPISIAGVTYLTVWATHWLAPLDWIPAVADTISGTALSDIQVPVVASKDESLVPYMQGPYKPEDVTTDLWKSVIKKELQRFLSKSLFGNTYPVSAVNDLLTKRDGSELPLSLKGVNNPLDVLVDVRKTFVMIEDDEVTLWDKLVRLAARYKFAIVPRISDFSIAPLLYVTGGESSQLKFRESYISFIQDCHMHSDHVFNAVFGFEDETSFPSAFDLSGKSNRKNNQALFDAASLQRAFLMRLPPWCYPVDGVSFNVAESMGLKAAPLLASGYFSVQPAEFSGQTLNQQYNAVSSKGAQAFATVSLAEQQWKERTCLLHSPLMFDLSPGSMIVVEPAMESITEAIVHTLIGCVRKLCLAISTQTNWSGTWLTVSHLHSDYDQTLVPWTEHPLYQRRYLRTPLLNFPGFTAQPETA